MALVYRVMICLSHALAAFLPKEQNLVLMKSLDLQDLGLSLPASARRRDFGRVIYEGKLVDHPTHLLRELSNKYTSAGCKPLALK
ncbi:hypothetical protein F4819DRAFT_451497 [Hypoxylon fuscum]|nr:hypothetical protein F4819DRAFT_451497 [Hypoxylon fuscum]